MQNADIARLLGEVADLLEISAGNPFKVRAYRNAARTVADHSDPLDELIKGGEFDLTDLPGIGDGIAKEITTLVQTGTRPQAWAVPRSVSRTPAPAAAAAAIVPAWLVRRTTCSGGTSSLPYRAAGRSARSSPLVIQRASPRRRHGAGT